MNAGETPALILATFVDRPSGALAADAFHVPLGLPATSREDLRLESTALPIGDDRYALAVAIDAPGFATGDAHVRVPPGGERVVELAARAAGKRLAG